ncbi:hypothetical protein DFR24_0098 [Panacagrimonas perspica]|uniref:DUF1993 domain-containing protein n=1 Tax=Panacagrimonas perspica TaxID=381431 RepID=A0A4S3K0W1_9GAMM|nr:DUF1993 domain-containing protein [Panacagrimonas perspica]TDU30744.1 hypothetical protein DFR24_0098 [Panacagrimonas perspica]THD01565.1 hypothetical protein B1810_18800 [Panacagrimonas perspica]
MSLGMYQSSIPALVRALGNLRQILAKAASHCEAKKIDPAVLIGFRLFPDMLPLASQVRIAGDMAKGSAARLGGLEVPKFEDNETTFAELDARIDKTLAFLATVTPAQIDGSEKRTVTIKTPRGDLNFEGQSYLQFFLLPNVYFHCTTAYNILRHNGVEIGKMDFIGAP